MGVHVQAWVLPQQPARLLQLRVRRRHREARRDGVGQAPLTVPLLDQLLRVGDAVVPIRLVEPRLGTIVSPDEVSRLGVGFVAPAYRSEDAPVVALLAQLLSVAAWHTASERC